jgi:hypothetical protein
MKTLHCTTLLLILLIFFTSKTQAQINQKTKVTTSCKSGELVFGDKKLTWIIEGKGEPCFVCADGTLQINCLSENLKQHFRYTSILMGGIHGPIPNFNCKPFHKKRSLSTCGGTGII